LKFLLPVAALAFLMAGCSGDSHDVLKLEEGLWVLNDARDVPLPAGVVPTAGFHESVLRGSTGCNQYTAPYTVDGDSMDIGAVASTRMACPSPRDTVEQGYVAALGLVGGWAIDGDELVLSDGDGAELLRYNLARTGGDI
jgi:heat shock protein HslJ